MIIRIEINTDNAALTGSREDVEPELRSMLGTVVDKLTAGYDNGGVLDSNGNTVGWWSHTDYTGPSYGEQS